MSSKRLKRPSNPYQIKSKQLNPWGIFPKSNFTVEQVDLFLGYFIGKILATPLKPREKVIIWRGEFQNDEIPKWVLGLSPGPPKRVYEQFFARNIYFIQQEDYFLEDAHTEGIKPYLLLLPGQIWTFNPTKDYGSISDITIGNIKMKVKNLSYRFTKEYYYNESAAEEIEKSLPYWYSLQKELGLSAYHNWIKVRRIIPQWLKEPHHYIYSDFKILKEICEDIIKIHVKEIDIPEYGRIILSPKFIKRDNNYTLADFNVYIGIKRGLSLRLKNITLAHEMGHYFYHLEYYVLLSYVSFAMMTKPEIEAAVAQILTPSILVRCQNIMECVADQFTLDLLLPEISPPEPWAPLISQLENDYTMIMYKIDEHGLKPRLSQDELYQMYLNLDFQATYNDYNKSYSLIDRLLKGILLRRYVGVQDYLATESMFLESILDKIQHVIMHHDEVMQNDVQKGKIFRRVSTEEAIGCFKQGNQWDPIVIEPAGNTECKGYIGIKPLWGIYHKDPARTDWHEIHDNERLPGFIEDYLNFAVSRSKGLMLFPVTPTEEKLRAEIESGKYLRKRTYKKHSNTKKKGEQNE